MKIQLDQNAGVCPGVARALELAEAAGENSETSVISVGPIIHNTVEIERLAAIGVKTMPQSDFEDGSIVLPPGSRLIVRAHGIAKTLRSRFSASGYNIIDATCPKVWRLHQIIAEFAGNGYQIAIIGKKGHAEVLGLAGVAADASVVIHEAVDIQKLNPAQKTLVIAQTTANAARFQEFTAIIKQRISAEVTVQNSLCRAVSSRHDDLRIFAAAADVLVFVGGRNSSNTRELFKICQAVNSRSFWIEKKAELEIPWFDDAELIGVSGSVSTPMRQLEQIRAGIVDLLRPQSG